MSDWALYYSAVTERQTTSLRDSAEVSIEGKTVRDLLIQVNNSTTKKDKRTWQ
jgi:hypothetical protein